MSSMIDIRHVLPAIRVPTLVLHRADEVLAEASRYVGERIPGAKVVELPGDNHMPWLGDEEAALDDRGVPHRIAPASSLDRVLATVLFTDIVGSTELAADLGDPAHDAPVEAADPQADAPTSLLLELHDDDPPALPRGGAGSWCHG
jgi:hypothetical protein